MCMLTAFISISLVLNSLIAFIFDHCFLLKTYSPPDQLICESIQGSMRTLINNNNYKKNYSQILKVLEYNTSKVSEIMNIIIFVSN